MDLRLLLLTIILSSLLGAGALSTTSVSTSQAGTQVIGSTENASGVCVPSQDSVCDPFATAFDSKGDLWIADGADNRVLEFPLVNGHISSNASSVIGQDNFTADACGSGPWPAYMRTSTLCFPDGLTFDSSGDLWVSDGGGSRVVEYPLVDGSISHQVSQIIGPNFSSSEPFAPLYGITLPVGLAFDKSGNLWVVDLSNSRVLEFPLVNGSISLTPSRAIGQGNLGEGACDQSSAAYNFQNATAYTLCEPSDLAFDQNGNLWVADFGHDPNLAGNSRVLMFPDVNGSLSSAAIEVIGQSSLTGYGCDQNLGGPTNDTLCYPVSIAFDNAGDLWVADSGNNRVLEFASVDGAMSPVASRVIGQGNFTTYGCNMGAAAPTNSTLCHPLWVAFDSHDDLWVSDTNNVRVLEFVAPATGYSGLETWLLIGGSAAFLVALVAAAVLLRRRSANANPTPAPPAEQPASTVPDPAESPSQDPASS
ncbi:MAG: NHL repeat-containing protein [Thaumarchaeota archaeon]|nr:NHL repeat-containing protein [Nitrososphaerota archaeon]